MNNKLRTRTKIKHFIFKLNKTAINYFRSFFSFYKYLVIKRNKDLKEINTLDDFYKVYKIKLIEGNVQQYDDQSKYLYDYSKNAERILEIGFNAGHSSELFLKSNPNSKVTSIDIGFWYYCKFGKEFLNRKYPNRLNVIFEDSKKITTVVKEKYDLIFIDGNHSYDYALSDLRNSRNFSHRKTFVILDDVEKNKNFQRPYNLGPTQAWEELINEGVIKEIDYVRFDKARGCAVGLYIFD